MNHLTDQMTLGPVLRARLFIQRLSIPLIQLWCRLRTNQNVRFLMELASVVAINEQELSEVVNAQPQEALIAAQLLPPRRGIEVARLLWAQQQKLNSVGPMAARLLDTIVSADCSTACRAWLLGLLSERPLEASSGIPYLFTSSHGLHHLVRVRHPLPERFCLYALETGYSSILKCIVHDLAQVYGLEDAQAFLSRLAGVSETRKILMLAVICTASGNSQAEQELYLQYLRHWSQQHPDVFSTSLQSLEHRKRLKLQTALSMPSDGLSSPTDPANT